MKKICFITTVSLTLDMFVVDFAKYLHANTDWDISFICNDDPDFAEKLPDYIHFFPVKMERGISISGFKAMLEMIEIFREHRFDLIQYSTPNASLYAALAGRIANIPVRLYCQWGMAYVGFAGVKRKIFKSVEKAVCTLSTWIEPDSNSNLVFSHREGLYPEHIGSVVWNGSACGVDFDKFDISKKDFFRQSIRKQLEIPANAFVFGYVGRITKDKGINELFEAAKDIFDSNRDVYLLMVGPEEIDDTIDRDLYSWSKKCTQVRFTGFTNVVEQYMAAMDCFVLPSYREGFGVTVIEAEAMALPVIVSNIPGPIDAMVNEFTGLIVEKQNVCDLESAMTKIMRDDKAYGINGCTFAREHFDQNTLFQFLLNDRMHLLGII